MRASGPAGVAFRRQFVSRRSTSRKTLVPLLLRLSFLALVALLLLTLLRRLSRAVRANEEAAAVLRPAYCDAPPPIICAHGGVTTGEGVLANTAPAYAAALAHPAVRCVEVDVSRTRDEALVALHARQLLRISDGDFVEVGSARLEELRAYGDRKGKAAMVFTLQEALSTLVGQGLEAIILDVKDGPPLGAAGMAGLALTALRAARCTVCIVWAKEDGIVRELLAGRPKRPVRRALRARAKAGAAGGRSLLAQAEGEEEEGAASATPEAAGPPAGGYRTGFVLMNESKAMREAGMHRLGRLAGADVVAAHWGMVDAGLVASARRRGLAVFGWTANEERMADALLRAGVAAVVTDDPDMVAARSKALRAAECGAQDV